MEAVKGRQEGALCAAKGATPLGDVNNFQGLPLSDWRVELFTVRPRAASLASGDDGGPLPKRFTGLARGQDT